MSASSPREGTVSTSLRGHRLWEVLALGVGLALFLGLALHRIELPGLYYDEALDAVPAMQLLLGQPVEVVRDVGIPLGDRALPLMVMDYVGPVNTYLLLPFFALFGVNVLALRLMTVVGGALTLVLTYAFARELFNRRVAGMAVILLAVHPSFVFFTRQGIQVTSVMAPIAVGALLCLSRWYRGREQRWLYLGLFLLGLGLTAKFLFLWLVLALGIIYVVLRRQAPLLGFGGYALGLGSFVVGAAPVLAYNLLSQGTLSTLAQSLVTSQEGVRNADFLTNLLARLHSLAVLLDGGYFWYLGGVFSHPLYPPLFAGAVLSLVGLAGNEGRGVRGAIFLLTLLGVILVESSFTISGLWATHLYFLLPLIAIVLAAALHLLWQGLPWRWLSLSVPALAGLILVGGSLIVDGQYHEALARSGGLASHSDASYRLAAYLEEQGASEPIAMDWGIKNSLQILTEGRVNPVEIFQHSAEPNDAFLNWLYGALSGPPRLYIFHTEQFTHLPRFAAFSELAERLGKEPVLEKAIGHRDGNPLYLVYSVP